MGVPTRTKSLLSRTCNAPIQAECSAGVNEKPQPVIGECLAGANKREVNSGEFTGARYARETLNGGQLASTPPLAKILHALRTIVRNIQGIWDARLLGHL